METYDGGMGCFVNERYMCTYEADSIRIHDLRSNGRILITAEDIDSMCACDVKNALFYFTWPGVGIMLDVTTGGVLGTWDILSSYSAHPDDANVSGFPDIELCVCGTTHAAGITDDVFVIVCRLDAPGETPRVLTHERKVVTASFHPTKNELVVFCSGVHSHNLYIWCTETWNLLRTVYTGSRVSCAAHSPCGNYLAMGDCSYTRIQVRRCCDYERLILDLWGNNLVTSIAFSPCSQFILTGDTQLNLCEWDWKQQQCLSRTASFWDITNTISLIDACAYVKSGAVAALTNNNSYVVPWTYYGHAANATYAYILKLLTKQEWWPTDVGGVVLSYLTVPRLTFE